MISLNDLRTRRFTARVEGHESPFYREEVVVSESEKAVLRTFRKYLISQGEMLCFFGPDLEKHKAALQQLIAKDWLVNEQFKGGYSLTAAGFKAMKTCGD